MRLSRNFLAAAISLSLVFVSFLSFSVQKASAQDSKIALQRGYRTGYSDGYMSGYRDAIENSSRSVERHKEYAKADRAYAKEFGALEDYRDGYQQGFENGYSTGFGKQNFNAALPNDLQKRGTVAVASNTSQETVIKEPVKTTPVNVPQSNPVVAVNPPVANPPAASPSNAAAAVTEPVRYEPTINQLNKDSIIVIPIETELVVELLSDINTNLNKEGDRFQARVVSPAEISGAIIEGRVSRIQKPGRIKRRSELQLSFDQIRVSDNRWSNFNALLAEVLPLKGDNVRRVDVEGSVEGKSSLKGDLVKVGAAAGTGVVIGAVAGGPVGAVVGGSVGTAFGVGAVVIERGKHVKLIKGQQLRIKTVYETQIR